MFGGEDGPVLQVMAERPDTRQLTLDDCGTLSRALSDLFDPLDGTPDDPLPEAYRLEVSSPGIDRPLTRPQDYSDWAGHLARFKLNALLGNRRQFDGELQGLDGEDILVSANGEALRLPLTQVASAKLVLTDKLIAATAPLVGIDEDVDAEELEEEDPE